jgi:hypothetical protein
VEELRDEFAPSYPKLGQGVEVSDEKLRADDFDEWALYGV